LKYRLRYFLILAVVTFLGVCCKSKGEKPRNNYPVEDSLLFKTALPWHIDESSGLVYIHGLWTHNDSGDDPVVYQVSTSKRSMLRSVSIKDIRMKDWEDITHDGKYMYIGDTGNNSGSRYHLLIYKVPIDSLLKEKTRYVDAEEIIFHFPDQTDYYPGSYNHNFDCEALISVGDSLYIFSKNHKNMQCRMYALPKSPGVHTARLIDTFNTDGMITGAAYDPDEQVVALLGYRVRDYLVVRSFQPFVWLFYQYPGRDFFRGKSKRINIPKALQMEGICYFRDGKFFISNESGSQGDGAVYLFDGGKWLEEPTRPLHPPPDTIYPQ